MKVSIMVGTWKLISTTNIKENHPQTLEAEHNLMGVEGSLLGLRNIASNPT